MSSTAKKAPITTHILDQTLGKPAVGVAVTLQWENPADGQMVTLAQAVTDSDGRITQWSVPLQLEAGVYQLLFDLSTTPPHGEFFPRISLTFVVRNTEQHYHVPLLLSPYGYSTYRGS